MDNLNTKADLLESNLEVPTQDLEGFYQQTLDPLNDKPAFKDYMESYSGRDDTQQPEDKILLETKPHALGPMQLISLLQKEPQAHLASKQAVCQVSKTQGALEMIFEKLQASVKVHISDDQTISIFSFPQESLGFEGLEIVITNYQSAQGVINIEINSCDKLQALLHKHKTQLVEALKTACPQVSVNRLDMYLKSDTAKKDRIEGSLMKKVVQTQKGSDDNQT